MSSYVVVAMGRKYVRTSFSALEKVEIKIVVDVFEMIPGPGNANHKAFNFLIFLNNYCY